MNLSDINNKIYGFKNLKQGEYANFMMKSIEAQEIMNFGFNNFDENNIDYSHGINKEIKF